MRTFIRLLANYLRKEVTKELIDMLVIERLSLIQENRIHILNERAARYEDINTTFVDLFRLINFIPNGNENVE